MKLTYHQRETVKRLFREYGESLTEDLRDATIGGAFSVEQGVYAPDVEVLDRLTDEIEKAVQP